MNFIQSLDIQILRNMPIMAPFKNTL